MRFALPRAAAALTGFALLATATPAPTQPAETPAQLAVAARTVFTTHCYRCHGKDGADEGGFGSILDRRRLVESKLIAPGDVAKSRLLGRVSKGEMPPPEEKVKFPAADLVTLKRWVEKGAPDWAAVVARRPIAIEDEIRLAAVDVSKLHKTPGVQPRFQYFTLSPLYNAGVPDDELDALRVGFFKLLNSFSSKPEIVLPTPINPEKTVYRVDPQLFGRSEFYTDRYPYSVVLRMPEAGGHEVSAPIRIDWFLANASRTDLYHRNAGIPWTVTELEGRLKVKADENIRAAKVIRAGFNGSGVSRHNRLIERHDGADGYYWKSYDFGGSTGRQNLFAHPTGPGPSEGKDTFKHDGGEIIFRLPNGLQGYMLADARGNRIDRGPTEIVSDPKHPEKVVENGVSCMSCHSGGLIDKADQLRPLAEPADSSFPAATRKAVLALHPPREKFEAAVKADAADYRAALAKLGAKPDAPDPVSAASRQYEGEIDLRRAAAEVWTTPEHLASVLKKLPAANSPTVAASQPLLTPGGTMKRDAFETVYRTLLYQSLPGINTHAPLEVRKAAAPAKKLSIVPADEFRAATRRVVPHAALPVIDPTFRFVAVHTKQRAGDRVEVFDLPTNELRFALPNQSEVFRVVFSPDGNILASSGRGGTILFVDTRSGKELGVTKDPKPRPAFEARPQIWAIAFSPDGKEVVAPGGGTDGELRFFDPMTGHQLRTAGRANFHLRNLHYMPDGKHLLKGVGVSDAKTDKNRTRLQVEGWGATAISPDGKYVGVVASRSGVHLFDGATFDEVGVERFDIGDPKRQEGAPVAAVFSPDGQHLVVAHKGGFLSVWGVPSLKVVRAVRCHPDQAESLQFTPDGKRLAACGSDGVIRFWNWAALAKSGD